MQQGQSNIFNEHIKRHNGLSVKPLWLNWYPVNEKENGVKFSEHRRPCCCLLLKRDSEKYEH